MNACGSWHPCPWPDHLYPDGWSVTAIGPPREVTDPEEIGRLQKIDLSSWAYGTQELFIRITPEILNGRWLRVSGQETPANHQLTWPADGLPPVTAI